MTTTNAELAADPFSIENLTKVIGAFTAIALGTGILFDVVYFYTINRSFIQLMVLSDHIESAAASVPLLVVFFLLLSGALWSTRSQRRLKLAGAIRIIAAMILLWAGSTFLVPVFFGLAIDNNLAFYSVGISLLFVVVVVAASAFVPNMSKTWLVLLLSTMWVGLTVSRSVTDALQATNSARFTFRAPTQIYLVNEGVLAGGIIRLMDKGALIFSEPGGNYIFIPKEQIRRIDSFPTRFRGNGGDR